MVGTRSLSSLRERYCARRVCASAIALVGGALSRDPLALAHLTIFREYEARVMSLCTMSLAPLLDAAPAIPLHAIAAMTAFVLGLVQFASPRERCRIGHWGGSGSA
jgi:hypothetical protein